MKKILSVLLSVVIFASSIVTVLAATENIGYENVDYKYYCNFWNHSAFASGVEEATDTLGLNTNIAHFLRDKETKEVFLSIEDLGDMTRTDVEKTDSGYNLNQGNLAVKLEETNDDSYLINFEVDGEKITIKYVKRNNTVYVKPEVLMAVLSADYSFETEDDEQVLMIQMPQFTFFEAVNGLDLSKYTVGNLLEHNVKDEDGLIGVGRYFCNFYRLYNQKAADILVNVKTEIFNPFGTDNMVSSELCNALADVLAYDPYTGEKAAENEVKVFKTMEDLFKLYKKTKPSSNSSGNEFLNAYIDTFAHSGAKDEKSLDLFSDTVTKLSKESKINDALKDVGGAATEAGMKILTNCVLEYIKRRSYDSNVLKHLYNTFSDDTVNKGGVKLGENDKKKYKCIMNYYNTCFSDDALMKEVVVDEISKAVTDFLVMGAFDWATGGVASKVKGVYSTVLTAEKLRERESKFKYDIKPITQISDSNEYMYLSVLQKMISDEIVCLDNSTIKTNPDRDSQLISALDMYYRTSIMMIKKLESSWIAQFIAAYGNLTSKEKEIIANTDQYIDELTWLLYKIENCTHNDFSESKLKNAMNSNMLEDKGSNGTITGKVLAEEYTALDLMDKSVSEIIELMEGEFQVNRAIRPEFYFYNDEVFPNVRFWIDYSEYSSMDYKNGEIYVDGKSAEQGLRDGDFSKFSIAPGSIKITDSLSSVDYYEDLTKVLGNVSIYYKPEKNRPPHTGGALPPMGVSLVYEYYIDNKIITFYFSNDGLVKDRYDENGQKIFTYEEAIEINPRCHAIEITIDNTTWRTAYKDILNEAIKEDNYEQYAFDLLDMNDDGVPELFLSQGTGHYDFCKVYSFINGKIINYEKLWGQMGVVRIDKNERVIISSGYTNGLGRVWTLFSRIDSNGNVSSDYFEYIPDGIDNAGVIVKEEYKYNNESVTEEEYKAELQKYANLNAETIGRGNALTKENMELIISSY